MQILRLNIQTDYSEYNLYSWPRLFLIVGYLLVGFIGDIRKRKYVPLAMLCIAMLAIFNPILLNSSEPYVINMCIFYVYLGAAISFYNLTFWSIAPKTRCPELWAGMGRVID